jgi:hypothetical protein
VNDRPLCAAIGLISATIGAGLPAGDEFSGEACRPAIE